MMVKLFRQNKNVGGFTQSGQEAISVGTAYSAGEEDWLAPMIATSGRCW